MHRCEACEEWEWLVPATGDGAPAVGDCHCEDEPMLRFADSACARWHKRHEGAHYWATTARTKAQVENPAEEVHAINLNSLPLTDGAHLPVPELPRWYRRLCYWFRCVFMRRFTP